MIDKNKTYKTRNGLPARVYATDGSEDVGFTVHGALLKEKGWMSYTWMKDGRVYKEVNHPHDLVEVKEKIRASFWVNILSDNRMTFWNSKAEADADVNKRIACVEVKIECEEGDGLEN